jgi:hypothetical protein
MPRPLTKRTRQGEPYTRPEDIDAQIDVALAQDLPTFRRSLAVLDRSSPDHLSSECLVHLIRDARRRGDQDRITAALPVLLARCETNVLRKIPDSLIPNAADVREEVLAQFAELFAVDGSDDGFDELDYFECRFNSAFATFRIDLVRKEKTRVRPLAPLSDYTDAAENDDFEEVFAHVSDLAKAINALPPDEREAVVLCRVMGYKEESESPDEVTAATICKVTGRTIRNRLKRAAAKLKEEV